jgi:hypothetical protein
MTSSVSDGGPLTADRGMMCPTVGAADGTTGAVPEEGLRERGVRNDGF